MQGKGRSPGTNKEKAEYSWSVRNMWCFQNKRVSKAIQASTNKKLQLCFRKSDCWNFFFLKSKLVPKNKVLRRPHHKHHHASLTVINRGSGANWCEPIPFFQSLCGQWTLSANKVLLLPFLFYTAPIKPVPTCLIGIICSFTLMFKQFCGFSWYANM